MGTAFVIQIVFVVAIFYFVFILPQRREQKKHREMLAALKPGDEVISAGGVVGEIVQLKDDRITLKSGDARLLLDRSRIAKKISE